MSVYSDIITDLFRKTVIGVVHNFRSYISTENVVNILQNIIQEISNDENNLQNDAEITCTGCLEEQPNQQAHMGIGGCMYEEL